MESKEESLITGYPNVISYECTRKILEQMEKNICKIKIGEEQGTGFFCKIPFPDKNNMLPVFITNNHVLNNELVYKKDSKIEIFIKDDIDIKEINLNNRMKYTDKENYDITIFEIKEEDNIKNYFELDDKIINEIVNNININRDYIDETIYITQYPEGHLSVSYGVLRKIDSLERYNFYHKCSTKKGSSGSPILNMNNKVIGIHKGGGNNNKCNLGSFLNYPVKEFIYSNYKYNIIVNTNEISEDDIINEEDEILLKVFNEKFHLKIKNTLEDKIEIVEKPHYNNEILEDLYKIRFKKLKELSLRHNNISDIKVLEYFKFEKLETLKLRHNNISDIGILEKVNFKNLKHLSLYDNKISDITVLEKVKFEKLEMLNLGGNILSDINILDKVNFKELKELYLDNNKIIDITVFWKTKFEKLEKLGLENNKLDKIRFAFLIFKLKLKIKEFTM